MSVPGARRSTSENFAAAARRFPSARRFGSLALSGLVFFVAVSVRWPSSAESFWVDELHTAWTIWGPLQEVPERAAVGHQTPVYFVVLWGWKQLFGGGESSLRMTSVLAVAVAAGVLSWGIGRYSRSLLAGAAAGLILALERNAIFFGTELRPYAWVVLAGAVVVGCSLPLWIGRGRGEHPVAWAGLVVAVLLAATVQPTSLAVLGWFPLVELVRGTVLRRPPAGRRGWLDLILLLASAGVALWLGYGTLAGAFRERRDWASFASTSSPAQWLELWDWEPLLGLPWLIMVAAWAAHRVGVGRDGEAAEQKDSRNAASLRRVGWLEVGAIRSAAWLSLIAMLSSWAVWGVAYAGLLPIWHRRYLVATLPALAAVSGLAVAAVPTPGRRGQLIRAATAVFLVVALLHHQGTLERLSRFPRPLVRRGEDWRGAVAWVRRHREPGEPVLLEAGLIEARRYLPEATSAEFLPRTEATAGDAWEMLPGSIRQSWTYLCYPLLGPYRAGFAGPEPGVHLWPTRSELLAEVLQQPGRWGDAETLWLISRRPANRLAARLDRLAAEHGELATLSDAEPRKFGGVSVVRISLPGS